LLEYNLYKKNLFPSVGGATKPPIAHTKAPAPHVPQAINAHPKNKIQTKTNRMYKDPTYIPKNNKCSNKRRRTECIETQRTKNTITDLNLEDFQVKRVPNEMCFFSLLDECGPEGFYHNRTSLLKEWCHGRLYTVVGCYNEKNKNNPMWSRYYDFCPHFIIGDDLMQMLPCFCAVDDNCCDFLWVHERIRRRGVATMMLDALKVKNVNEPLPQAKAFWDKYLNKEVE